MAKQSASIECSNCANVCVIYGVDADMVQFCPYCGDGVLLSYDNVDTNKLVGGAFAMELDIDMDDDDE